MRLAALLVSGLIVVSVAEPGVAQIRRRPFQSNNPAPTAPVIRPASAPTTATATAATTNSPDDQAIRQTVAAFTKAYNAHDAKALAALFTTDAEIVGERGNVSQGRAAIERAFAGLFGDYPKTQIEIAIGSIRFLGAGVAIEDGFSTVKHELTTPGERVRYSVVHVKQDGKWQMASARDLADNEAKGIGELEQLGWLVGEWVDESPEGLLTTVYRWSDNRHFILGEFTMQIAGRSALTGSQRIGWDPAAKTVRSWVFDSEGGFSEGIWARNKAQWTIKLSGVTRDGRQSSATNVITQLRSDRYSFESHDRIVGGEVAGNSSEIVVVRQPPKPMK